jgi:hypothetical protein
VSGLDDGVAAVADVDFDFDEDEDEDEGEGELEEALELVADELAELVALLAADVADVALAVLAAMFAPRPRNAHTLSAAANNRDRAAAWRRRTRRRDLSSIGNTPFEPLMTSTAEPGPELWARPETGLGIC